MKLKYLFVPILLLIVFTKLFSREHLMLETQELSFTNSGVSKEDDLNKRIKNFRNQVDLHLKDSFSLNDTIFQDDPFNFLKRNELLDREIITRNDGRYQYHEVATGEVDATNVKVEIKDGIVIISERNNVAKMIRLPKGVKRTSIEIQKIKGKVILKYPFSGLSSKEENAKAKNGGGYI